VAHITKTLWVHQLKLLLNKRRLQWHLLRKAKLVDEGEAAARRYHAACAKEATGGIQVDGWPRAEVSSKEW